ncbi:GTP-binding protein ERG [Apium graveolens]|uniref:GTP-binding protein ERG n=1 Tax=Apium graveolens TaxID=4045 RepID=UPI003D7A93A4
MKALRVLRTLSSSLSKPHFNSPLKHPRFYSESQPQLISTPSEDENGDGVFDSAQFEIPSLENLGIGKKIKEDVGWDERFRERAEEKVFGKKVEGKRGLKVVEREEQKRRRAAVLARTLLEAAVGKGDEEEDEVDCLSVKEEDQKSLNVGIIGAPNAGKSALTNFMVGTKVAGVSRKTNTTTHEVLGVMTKGDTQICFFDTPGLILNRGGYPSKDIKVRVECAWSAIGLYDILIVIFDVHRHLNRPDSRVVRLIERMGSEANPKQKRILCMNKVDLVEKKKDLLKVAEKFKELPGYEKYFMISGLNGSGVKDLTRFLMEQAVKRPWDEDPLALSEEVMKNISLEVVRERLLDHIHQEIPYDIDHRLVDWKELRDGSIRIEQHFITHKLSQRKILVGKNGSKIGRIGVEANEELRSIFKRNVHLILQVRLK